MDGNGSMNYRNWGFYEPPGGISGHLGLQLMSGGHGKPLPGGRAHPSMMNNSNFGPFHHMPTNSGLFHHRVGGLSESPMLTDFVRDSWINPRDKYFGGMHSSHHQQQHHHHSSFSLLPETSAGQEMQMLHLADSPYDEEGVTQLDDIDIERDIGKKRTGGKNQKSPKSKKSKKGASRDDGSVSVQRARVPKKSLEIVVNGVDMDISSIPIPVCSCTGAPQQSYRWGSGGWQSACCTTGMSVYPLPMSTKRRGARISGRKMSIGAFKKVLEKLDSEGYNFSHPIDLRSHWAKHGTNKFVTIR